MTKNEGRTSITVVSSYVVLRGTVVTGITVNGPFNSPKDAIAYGGKFFPDDTFCVCTMYKEIEDG